LIVPGLATWDPVANAAKRLIAREDEMASGDRAALAPLADALVEARLLTRGGETLEVAHEALLRRQPISGWLEEQKDALKLRDDVLREAKEWADGDRHADGLMRRGTRLEAALSLQTDPDFTSVLAPARSYLAACQHQETAAKRRARRTVAAMFILMLGVIAALTGVTYKEPIIRTAHHVTTVGPYIAANITPHLLTDERERALKPGATFRECAKACPEMVVIPANTFVMGSPDGKTPIIGLDGKPKDGLLAPTEKGRSASEGPQHEVKVAIFAAGKHEVTYDDYDECVRLKGCTPVSDSGWGRGRRPVINVSWNQARQYVDWLACITGKPYRLLTEAEWEYAARAGSATPYATGHSITTSQAHFWVGNPPKPTVDVGSFPANAFGLHDMHGNVYEWVQDCWNYNHDGAPSDGSARTTGTCSLRVIRGGSRKVDQRELRSAVRNGYDVDYRDDGIGFRVGRTLSARAGAITVAPGAHLSVQGCP
jgi:formylglycine-generating enzyme required for sulfatase activity